MAFRLCSRVHQGRREGHVVRLDPSSSGQGACGQLVPTIEAERCLSRPSVGEPFIAVSSSVTWW